MEDLIVNPLGFSSRFSSTSPQQSISSRLLSAKQFNNFQDIRTSRNQVQIEARSVNHRLIIPDFELIPRKGKGSLSPPAHEVAPLERINLFDHPFDLSRSIPRRPSQDVLSWRSFSLSGRGRSKCARVEGQTFVSKSLTWRGRRLPVAFLDEKEPFQNSKCRKEGKGSPQRHPKRQHK